MKDHAAARIHEFKDGNEKTWLMYVRDEAMDFSTAASCICNDDYRFRKIAFDYNTTTGRTNMLTLIDAGAYIGAATVAGLAQGWRAIAIEPVPWNLGLVAANIALNEFVIPLDAKVMQMAIGADTLMKFYWCREEELTHRYMGNVTTQQGEHSAVVKSWPMREYIRIAAHKFRDRDIVIKLDCEGGEWEGFKDIHKGDLDRVRYITGELHNGDPDVRLPEFMGMLHGQFEDYREQFNAVPGHFILRHKP